MLWAMEALPNPSVLRLHTTEELTDRTILTCPPGAPPTPLDRLLAGRPFRTRPLADERAAILLPEVPDIDRRRFDAEL